MQIQPTYLYTALQMSIFEGNQITLNDFFVTAESIPFFSTHFQMNAN